MTESFAYSTINYPFRADKIGTVGNAGPGIELKIADDSEIMVRSKGLFSGYYKNDIATQESLIQTVGCTPAILAQLIKMATSPFKVAKRHVQNRQG